MPDKANVLPRAAPLHQALKEASVDNLTRAIKELKLDVPVYGIIVHPGGAITFNVYGRDEPITWRPDGPSSLPPARGVDRGGAPPLFPRGGLRGGPLPRT